MAENRNTPCCYFCRKDLPNIESNATNLKCEDCVQKMESAPSGLPFKMANEDNRYDILDTSDGNKAVLLLFLIQTNKSHSRICYLHLPS